MTTLPFKPDGIFFDLDGTLLDSAQDLYAAIVQLCDELKAPHPEFAPLREVVSRGSRAMIAVAFPDFDADAVLRHVPRFLAIYEENMGLAGTHPFDGVEPLLSGIEAAGMRWGIVTNKPGFLTEALLPKAVPHWKPAAVVAGDTLPVKKPDPAPVIRACEIAGCAPMRSVFVGDDRRDVQAGRAAGLYTVAVRWGYLDGGNPEEWGADLVIDHPDELATLLGIEVAA